MTTTLALRVDVDTFRGTRDGVPRLLAILATHGVHATFFFTLGPDNMGRHLRRVLRPRFVAKMFRSRAASLYGWDILLAGTFWPGREIGSALRDVLRATEVSGHEVGLHAWDHYKWQVHALRMSKTAVRDEIRRGVVAFNAAFGRPPDCTASAGWICDGFILAAKEEFGFRYNSDCRGRSVFTPVVAGERLTPQIPTTLPTYDELIGRDGVTDENYNDELFKRIVPTGLNVLTVHAEVEGISRASLFESFLVRCREQRIAVSPLRNVLGPTATLPRDGVCQGPIAGRDGSVCWQSSAAVA